jgi:hypothetical protein
MDDAFFQQTDAGRYTATQWTRGPWSPNHQHAGPPSALLGHVLEEAAPQGGRIARCTMEILSPVPIGPVAVTARVIRPGRSVVLVGGELLVDGQPVIQATGWWLRTEEDAVPAATGLGAPVSGPEECQLVQDVFAESGDVSYFHAIEWRFASGSAQEAGPAAAWMRMRVPLIADEEPSPLARVLTAADSGNGISSVLPLARYLFVNTDLTVHLHRHPVGEWVLLDAATTIEADGIGLASAVLSDERGPIGRSTQTLFVSAR